MLKSCLTVLGVLLMSQAYAEPMTTATASRAGETSVPTYLVNWDMPTQLVDLVRRGELTKADEWLAKQAATDAKTSEAFTNERQRLKRMSRDFDMTAERLLEKIQRQVPDATLADIDAWRMAGALQWMGVDGKVLYFRREPSNLFLFEESARSRRKSQGTGGDPAGAKENELTKHIAEAVTHAKETGTATPMPMRFLVKHKITVKPGVVPAGETIRCWMPYTQEYRQQQEPRLISSTPGEPVVAPNGVPMRTLYFEQPATAAPAVFEAVYEYSTSAFVPDLSKPTEGIAKLTDEERATYLAAEPPHVEFTSEVKDLAAEIVGSEQDPMKKAFAIWSWIDKNIPWAAEIEYAVLPNIVRKVIECKRGDCGTQALLFMSLCRASGVPARWQSGWVMRPKNWNLHDWAEFYTDTHGWLPADPSIGRREGSEDPAVRDFLFGHLDTYRMIANLDYAKQFVPAKQHLRSDPIDNQRGEVEWRGGNLYFDDWSYDVEVSVK